MGGLGHQHRTVAKSKNWVDWAGAPGRSRALSTELLAGCFWRAVQFPERPSGEGVLSRENVCVTWRVPRFGLSEAA